MSTVNNPVNPQKSRRGLDRIWHATLISLDGFRAGWGEAAFRQEVLCAVVMVPAAFWVGRTWVETALLAAVVILVMVVELLNTGIEAAGVAVADPLGELRLHAASGLGVDDDRLGLDPAALAVVEVEAGECLPVEQDRGIRTVQPAEQAVHAPRDVRGGLLARAPAAGGGTRRVRRPNDARDGQLLPGAQFSHA
jgi:diacylglycerol kinase